MVKKDGTTVVTHVVEVDIYVSVNNNKLKAQYKSADVSTIKTNLELEYNNHNFKDDNGNNVEFRFNMHELDVAQIQPVDAANQLRKDPENLVKTLPGEPIAQKGFVMQKNTKFYREEGGLTKVNLVTIDANSDDSHTQAHEVMHVFMNYDMANNPTTAANHSKMAGGGIFIYEVHDENHNVTTPAQGVNQGNVDAILKSVPKVQDKVVNEK